jgi:hypothetical protein
MTTTNEDARQRTAESRENGYVSSDPDGLLELRQRATNVAQLSRDLVDDIDVLLRQALGLSKDDSDELFANRASMMVVNYRQKSGE